MDGTLALAALQRARVNLRAARIDAHSAAGHLCGARAARAFELAEKLADVLAFCERLAFCVQADLRYDQGMSNRGVET